MTTKGKNVNGNCFGLTPDELEVTVFGQGKHQQLKAIALCENCPIAKRCTRIAENMAVIGREGDIVDGAWGVFGGKAYRAGRIVR